MHALMIRATLMAMFLLSLSLALVHVQLSDRIDAHPAVVRNAPPETTRSKVSSYTARPITLPTIQVRISPAEMARIGRESVEHADAMPADFAESGRIEPSLYRTLRPALPRVRLDMPYYSFGKTLSRANKD